MLKRSSSSSLRLWTRTQRGGAFFVSDKTEIVFFESSFFRGRERAKERKSASETTTTMDAPDYTREREMIRLNPTTTTQKSLSPSFSLRVVSLKTHKTIHTTGPTHAHTKKKPNERRLVVFVFFLSLVFLARCFFWRQSRAARQKASNTKNAREITPNKSSSSSSSFWREKKNNFINPKQKQKQNPKPCTISHLFLFFFSFLCVGRGET